MAQPSSILSADRGRASATAWGILSALVLIQIILVGSFILTPTKMAIKPVELSQSALPAGTAPQSVVPPAAPLTPTARLSPPPVGSLAPLIPVPASAISPTGPPAIGSFAAPGLPPTPAPTLAAPVSPGPAFPSAASSSETTPPPWLKPAAAAPQATAPNAPPKGFASSAKGAPPPGGSGKLAGLPPPQTAPMEMSLQEMVELAKQVRGIGDMQGALEVLKRADLQFPNNPAVLAETAQCYEQMGLSEKAAANWRQLEAMDPAKAAGYKDLASRRLSAPQAAATATAPTASTIPEGPKVLSLGACHAVRDASITTGEKVVLRIPVLRQGNGSVDPTQVDIDVFFFDRVNGEKVAQSVADDPVTNWSALPVDWSGIGEEPLDVTYFLPQLTPGEIQVHGRRSYHGYVVKLYYQHKLQDISAEPRDLLDFGFQSAPRPPASGGNPLLPPVTN